MMRIDSFNDQKCTYEMQCTYVLTVYFCNSEILRGTPAIENIQ